MVHDEKHIKRIQAYEQLAQQFARNTNSPQINIQDKIHRSAPSTPIPANFKELKDDEEWFSFLNQHLRLKVLGNDINGFKEWKNDMLDALFNVPLVNAVRGDMEYVEKNLRKCARFSQMLVIFTD